jgi:hypothetical protein
MQFTTFGQATKNSFLQMGDETNIPLAHRRHSAFKISLLSGPEGEQMPS